MSDIGYALILAKTHHSEQVDKAGQPYIDHVLRVSLAQTDTTSTIVALLHDIVEDTSLGLDKIRLRFGDTVANAVDAITKREDETLDQYLERVRGNQVARTVKMADVLDNSDPMRLSVLPEEVQTRLQAKYEKTFAALKT